MRTLVRYMLRIEIHIPLHDPMKNIFSSPSLDDLINLLKAWRFWVLGALFGAVIGAAIYYIAPPQYRARATVNVDFNLEQAWPKDVDRQQFFYLDRETRKMIELSLIHISEPTRPY